MQTPTGFYSIEIFHVSNNNFKIFLKNKISREMINKWKFTVLFQKDHGVYCIYSMEWNGCTALFHHSSPLVQTKSTAPDRRRCSIIYTTCSLWYSRLQKAEYWLNNFKECNLNQTQTSSTYKILYLKSLQENIFWLSN